MEGRMNLFKKIKKLHYGQHLEVVGMCAATALLVLAAVFISGGGIERSSVSLALRNISPSSQTAQVWPCSWTGTCQPATSYYYSLVASQTSITPGQQVQLVYTSGLSQTSGASLGYCQPSGAQGMTCTLTDFGTVYTDNATRSGTVFVYPIATKTYTFCSNVFTMQGTGCQSVTIYVQPIPTSLASFAASPAALPGSNTGTTLSWSGAAGTYFTGCTLSGGQWGSGVAVGINSSAATAALAASTAYTVTCNDATYGPTSRTITVPVGAAVSADASISPVAISAGQSATISFFADSATPPTQCRINNYNDTATLYNVAGCSSAQARTYNTGPLNTPGTYSYKFYYYQNAWVYVKTVTVSVAPACTLSASPNPVTSGNTTTLTYASNGATSGSINNGVAALPHNTPGTTPVRQSFTSNGSWVAPAYTTSVQYLVVAGGGGGGSGYGGGGGGGGGVLAGTLAVTPNNSYTVTVGAGGAGASGSLNTGYGGLGGHGNNSVFGSVTATGGGGGAYGGGASGGSGGGGGGNGGVGGGAGTAGQGYNGGAAVAGPVNYGGGGGGGAGGSGAQAPSSQNGGTGGPGYTSSITGTSRVYSAGGGGGGEGGAGGYGGNSNTGGHGGGGGGNVGLTSPVYYGSGGGGGGSSAGWASGTAGYQGIVSIVYTPNVFTPNGAIATPAITATPTTFTMTVNHAASGLSGQCSVPVTINDTCTDISGFQSSVPSGCTGPVPSPSGLCIPAGYTYNGSACVASPPTISGFAGPTRVRKGTTATLTYTVSNPPASCTITGNNGYSTTTSPSNGVQSPPVTTNAITSNTTFTLTCGSVTSTATVGITPEFQEI